MTSEKPQDRRCHEANADAPECPRSLGTGEMLKPDPDPVSLMRSHTPNKIVIHCTDTPDGMCVSMKALRRDHQNRGFFDIGYHWLIQPTGDIEACRPEDKMGAGVAQANMGAIHVALAGRERFSVHALKALRKLVHEIRDRQKIANCELYCHHEFASARIQGKTCPNISVSKLKEIVDGAGVRIRT